MIIKKSFVRCFLCMGLALLGASALHANGGPWVAGVAGTGSAGPGDSEAKTEVSIEDESLAIDLHQEFADVEVRYRMRNAGAAVNQTFYFPVDGEGGKREPEKYNIEVDGKSIGWEIWGKAKFVGPDGPFQAATTKPVRHWHRSTIPFGKQQDRIVVIRYRAGHFVAGESFSDDIVSGPTQFSYALSPASGWKDPIGKGTVVINLKNALPERVVIDKPKGRFQPDGPNRWKWTFTDLRPTLDDDIRVTVAPAFERYPGPNPDSPKAESVRYIAEDGKYYLRHNDFEVRASSELRSEKPGEYAAVNIKRGYPKPWAEGVEGDGVGESLEISVPHPRALAAILVMPGYADSAHPEYWSANNRVAEFEITLNGEHRFHASIPDEKFSDLYPIPIRGYNKPVRTIRLVIADVHRGTAYHDTCISWVCLLAKLTTKPKVRRK